MHTFKNMENAGVEGLSTDQRTSSRPAYSCRLDLECRQEFTFVTLGAAAGTNSLGSRSIESMLEHVRRIPEIPPVVFGS